MRCKKQGLVAGLYNLQIERGTLAKWPLVVIVPGNDASHCLSSSPLLFRLRPSLLLSLSLLCSAPLLPLLLSSLLLLRL